jgi:hypothetical protein
MAEGGKDIAVKQAHKATRATCWNLLVLNHDIIFLYAVTDSTLFDVFLWFFMTFFSLE